MTNNAIKWINKIDEYVNREKLAAQRAEEAAERERSELEAKARSYASRVSDMIDVMNHIRLYTDLNLHSDSKKGYDGGYFDTDSYYHRLGFIVSNLYTKHTPITKIGIYAGGAWGTWNFIYEILEDGTALIYEQHESTRATKPASTEQLRRFLDKFDEFEQAFDAYLEKITQ